VVSIDSSMHFTARTVLDFSDVKEPKQMQVLVLRLKDVSAEWINVNGGWSTGISFSIKLTVRVG
jgi:hypothetical protein